MPTERPVRCGRRDLRLQALLLMAAHVYPGKLIGAHASIHRNLPTALLVEALVYFAPIPAP